MFLSENTFETVIASTPLISIDLVVKNSQGQYLLGYRNNKPVHAAGTYLAVKF
jgi:colanic acid biosynthesis protein WcaH